MADYDFLPISEGANLRYDELVEPAQDVPHPRPEPEIDLGILLEENNDNTVHLVTRSVLMEFFQAWKARAFWPAWWAEFYFVWFGQFKFSTGILKQHLIDREGAPAGEGGAPAPEPDPNRNQNDPPPIWVIRSPERDENGDICYPELAYALEESDMACIDGDGRKICFGVAYQQIGDKHSSLYYAPPENSSDAIKMQRVAIKIIDKPVMDTRIDRGRAENYKMEIHCLREFENEDCVLDLLDALQVQHTPQVQDAPQETREFVCIVTPRACPEQGTLTDWIHRSPPVKGKHDDELDDYNMGVHYVLEIYFCQVLKILQVLESKEFKIGGKIYNGLEHADLKPDNFLFSQYDKLVIYDFAMARPLPFPPGSATKRQKLENAENEVRRRAKGLRDRAFGTPPYMPPETYKPMVTVENDEQNQTIPVARNQSKYCGVYSDLWASAVTLFEMLLQRAEPEMRLYQQPHFKCPFYNFNIVDRGIAMPDYDPVTEPPEGLQFSAAHRAYAADTAAAAVNDGQALDEVDYWSKQEDYLNRQHKRYFHAIQFGPPAILLENLLRPNPKDRWSLGEAVRFVANGGEGGDAA